MPLSTSSFKRALPARTAAKRLLLGLIVGGLLMVVAENWIRLAGGVPNVRDTAELWASQRARASALGDEALVLIGSSRIQLGMDLKAIEHQTGKKAVQLAIDGSAFLDVLDHLADDPTVRGTVLISSGLRKLSSNQENERPRQWIGFYDREYRHLWSPAIEQRFKTALQSTSALYANIIPLDALGPLLLNKGRIVDPYLKTLPSRERNADYLKVKMPEFYVNRVRRHLGHDLPAGSYKNLDEFGREVLRVADAHRPATTPGPENFVRIENALAKLKGRGVKVAIVHFPASGLVRAIDEIRYPKHRWDQVTRVLSATVIDYRDYPQLQFRLVDGAHLDMRQKGEFTRRLAAILIDKGVI
jgi:hypothetical protein